MASVPPTVPPTESTVPVAQAAPVEAPLILEEKKHSYMVSVNLTNVEAQIDDGFGESGRKRVFIDEKFVAWFISILELQEFPTNTICALLDEYRFQCGIMHLIYSGEKHDIPPRLLEKVQSMKKDAKRCNMCNKLLDIGEINCGRIPGYKYPGPRCRDHRTTNLVEEPEPPSVVKFATDTE
jgi:hypothetical protein